MKKLSSEFNYTLTGLYKNTPFGKKTGNSLKYISTYIEGVWFKYEYD